MVLFTPHGMPRQWGRCNAPPTFDMRAQPRQPLIGQSSTGKPAAGEPTAAMRRHAHLHWLHHRLAEVLCIPLRKVPDHAAEGGERGSWAPAPPAPCRAGTQPGVDLDACKNAVVAVRGEVHKGVGVAGLGVNMGDRASLTAGSARAHCGWCLIAQSKSISAFSVERRAPAHR